MEDAICERIRFDDNISFMLDSAASSERAPDEGNVSIATSALGSGPAIEASPAAFNLVYSTKIHKVRAF